VNPDVYQGKTIQWNSGTTAMMIFMFSGLIWLLAVTVGKFKFIVMSCAAQFYFSSNKAHSGSAGVCSSSWLASMTHIGSIALGSFIHMIVVWLDILCNMLADVGRDSENACFKLIACLVVCWVRCIEAAIEHLNSLAFAMVAISGDSYCKSAWNGFLLNLKHCIKFYLAKSFASGFVFLGILAVVAANMGTCWLLMKEAFPEAQQVTNIWGPISTIGVATFVTAILFLGTFDEAVQATLLCFAVDMELN